MIKQSQQLVLIAAVARNGAIGRGNDLLFREPADQRYFRDATTGCPVIMGRKTWDSLPARFRPLPNRRNLLVSRNAAFHADGAEVVPTLQAALALAADAPRVCVIGGAQLFALALPLADELLLTEVDADLEGDTFFPDWDRSAFIRSAQPQAFTAAGVPYRFVRYQRKGTAVTA